MFTVYVLESILQRKLYVGLTENLEQRLKEHNSGKSKFTSGFMPWKIIYSENVTTREEARKLEKYYKSAAGKRRLKKILSGGSLPD